MSDTIQLSVYNKKDLEVYLPNIPGGAQIELGDIMCTHTHRRGDEYKQQGIDLESSLQEAQKGGFRTTIGMPNTKPAIITLDELKKTIERIETFESQQEEENKPYHLIHFGVTDENIEICKIALKEKRVAGLKIYPAAKEEGKSVTTAFGDDKAAVKDYSVSQISEWKLGKRTTLEKAAEACIDEDKTLTIHCETPGLSQEIAEAEHDYIQNTILPLAKRYPKLKLVVAHVTSKKSVELITQCNVKNTTNIYMEITPHHMYYNKDDIRDFVKHAEKRGFPQEWQKMSEVMECYPQLRDDDIPTSSLGADKKTDGIEEGKKTIEEGGDDNRDYLGRLISQIGKMPGLKIMLGTDHAPHSLENKQKGFRGLANIQDSIAVILTVADENNATLGQVQQFISGTATELHKDLLAKASNQKSIFKKLSAAEIIEASENPSQYYNGVVVNPFQGDFIKYSKGV